MSEYEADILLWSEHQAALLRRRAAGDLVNEADIDWENVAEEIESVGRSERAAVKSQLRQALLHMLKAQAWPLSREVAHWLSEARIARLNAADSYAPSMRQRIDVAVLYAQALRAMPETIDDVRPLPIDQSDLPTLDELLSDKD